MIRVLTSKSPYSKPISRRPPHQAILLAILSIAAVVVVPNPWSGIVAFVCTTTGLSLIIPLRKVISGYGCFLLYAAIWGAFHALRARADNSEYANQVSSLILRLERVLFWGNVPSSWLQSHFYEKGHFHWYDYLLTGVYASFFIAPLVFAIATICMNRSLFYRYALALAALFSIGCMLFFALPTMPPWMASSLPWDPPPHIERIAFQIMGLVQAQFTGKAGETISALDANPSAAVPSIHTAVTMLFFLASRQYRRRWQIVSLCYVVLMGIALVYLGEHSVLDVVAGILAAVAAWRISVAAVSRWHSWVPTRFPSIQRSILRTRSTSADLHRQ
ncbi:MAG: hypothetical protein KatS3mg059_1158 [Thermomicrobiales bacterium]|nr:MAG: hypothetical protein KatS3mg059_1158 [Thermomicrobiales bacterium]